MASPLTPAEQKQIVQMFKNGHVVSVIARRLSRSDHVVRDHLKRVGVWKRSVYKIKEPERYGENVENRNSGIPDYLI